MNRFTNYETPNIEMLNLEFEGTVLATSGEDSIVEPGL